MVAEIQSELIAQRILDRQVALIRKGGRGLLGIGFAGEIQAHAVLDPNALEQLASRASAIAKEIRRELRPAPKRKPRAKQLCGESPHNSPAETCTDSVQVIDPTPEPTLIELAKSRNRAQVERLRERLAGVRMQF